MSRFFETCSRISNLARVDSPPHTSETSAHHSAEQANADSGGIGHRDSDGIGGGALVQQEILLRERETFLLDNSEALVTELQQQLQTAQDLLGCIATDKEGVVAAHQWELQALVTAQQLSGVQPMAAAHAEEVAALEGQLAKLNIKHEGLASAAAESKEQHVQEMQQLQQQLDGVQPMAAAHAEEVAALEGQLVKLNHEYWVLANDLAAAHAEELAALQWQLAKVNNEHEVLASAAVECKEQHAQEVQQLQQLLSDVQDKAAFAAAETAALRVDEIATQQLELVTLRGGADKLLSQIETLQMQHKDQVCQLQQETSCVLDQAETTTMEYAQEVALLQRELTELRREQVESVSTLEANDQLHGKPVAAATHAEEVAVLEGQSAALQEKHKVLESALPQQLDDVPTMAAAHAEEVAALEGRLTNLQEQREVLENAAVGCKEVAVQQQQLSDVRDRAAAAACQHAEEVALLETELAKLREERLVLASAAEECKLQHAEEVAVLEGHLAALQEEHKVLEKSALQQQLNDVQTMAAAQLVADQTVAWQQEQTMVDLEDQISSLEDTIATLQGELDSAKLREQVQLTHTELLESKVARMRADSKEAYSSPENSLLLAADLPEAVDGPAARGIAALPAASGLDGMLSPHLILTQRDKLEASGCMHSDKKSSLEQLALEQSIAQSIVTGAMQMIAQLSQPVELNCYSNLRANCRQLHTKEKELSVAIAQNSVLQDQLVLGWQQVAMLAEDQLAQKRGEMDAQLEASTNHVELQRADNAVLEEKVAQMQVELDAAGVYKLALQEVTAQEEERCCLIGQLQIELAATQHELHLINHKVQAEDVVTREAVDATQHSLQQALTQLSAQQTHISLLETKVQCAEAAVGKLQADGSSLQEELTDARTQLDDAVQREKSQLQSAAKLEEMLAQTHVQKEEELELVKQQVDLMTNQLDAAAVRERALQADAVAAQATTQLNANAVHQVTDSLINSSGIACTAAASVAAEERQSSLSNKLNGARDLNSSAMLRDRISTLQTELQTVAAYKQSFQTKMQQVDQRLAEQAAKHHIELASLQEANDNLQVELAVIHDLGAQEQVQWDPAVQWEPGHRAEDPAVDAQADLQAKIARALGEEVRRVASIPLSTQLSVLGSTRSTGYSAASREQVPRDAQKHQVQLTELKHNLTKHLVFQDPNSQLRIELAQNSNEKTNEQKQFSDPVHSAASSHLREQHRSEATNEAKQQPTDKQVARLELTVKKGASDSFVEGSPHPVIFELQTRLERTVKIHEVEKGEMQAQIYKVASRAELAKDTTKKLEVTVAGLKAELGSAQMSSQMTTPTADCRWLARIESQDMTINELTSQLSSSVKRNQVLQQVLEDGLKNWAEQQQLLQQHDDAATAHNTLPDLPSKEMDADEGGFRTEMLQLKQHISELQVLWDIEGRARHQLGTNVQYELQIIGAELQQLVTALGHFCLSNTAKIEQLESTIKQLRSKVHISESSYKTLGGDYDALQSTLRQLQQVASDQDSELRQLHTSFHESQTAASTTQSQSASAVSPPLSSEVAQSLARSLSQQRLNSSATRSKQAACNQWLRNMQTFLEHNLRLPRPECLQSSALVSCHQVDLLSGSESEMPEVQLVLKTRKARKELPRNALDRRDTMLEEHAQACRAQSKMTARLHKHEQGKLGYKQADRLGLTVGDSQSAAARGVSALRDDHIKPRARQCRMESAANDRHPGESYFSEGTSGSRTLSRKLHSVAAIPTKLTSSKSPDAMRDKMIEKVARLTSASSSHSQSDAKARSASLIHRLVPSLALKPSSAGSRIVQADSRDRPSRDSRDRGRTLWSTFHQLDRAGTGLIKCSVVLQLDAACRTLSRATDAAPPIKQQAGGIDGRQFVRHFTQMFANCTERQFDLGLSLLDRSAQARQSQRQPDRPNQESSQKRALVNGFSRHKPAPTSSARPGTRRSTITSSVRNDKHQRMLVRAAKYESNDV